MTSDEKNYAVVTAGYWGFTITDGAIRMLVVLYFHLLGYSPLEVAMLFLFYEFFGVVTNLVGGWLGARIGLNLTMHIGMALQVVALLMLTVPESWLTVVYVMAAQALSGIAKDLNKMSAKASVKLFATDNGSTLFKWVSALTGSKNALKGLGFFVGAALLQAFGFQKALFVLAGALFSVFIVTVLLLPAGVGKLSGKPKFTQIFSTSSAVNILSAARFFLFSSRDVWFVVALPVFLYSELGYDFSTVGASLAGWIIVYGGIQAVAPRLLGYSNGESAPTGITALLTALALVLVPSFMALSLSLDVDAFVVLLVGLLAFAVVFAVNSAVHSFLILSYSSADNVSMNVGFYYMSNAAGRLVGTVLSGLMYQSYGLVGCLWVAAALVACTIACSVALPRQALQHES